MIAAGLEAARAATLELVRDLDDEALCAQPDPAFSPIGWHLGHVGFTEAQWILSRVGGDGSLVAPYARRWAQDGCPKHERAHQPPKAELLGYLAEVRARVLALLLSLARQDRTRAAGAQPAGQRRDGDRPADALGGDDPLLAEGFVAWLIECHEHQHRETMAVVRQLALEGASTCEPPPPSGSWSPDAMLEIDAADAVIGTDARLAYDNERPAHPLHLAPYAIDRAPATVLAWEAFRADGGYARQDLWSAEGWAWREREDVRWPRGWTRDEGGRLARMQLDGALAPLNPSEPVTGVSLHEAEAFARWRGARLPTEAEWEHASPQLDGIGQAWEWTASAFAPYPGFRAFPYRGYSEPYFDGAHRVLRGGSALTHPRIARRTFRNWYAPTTRQLAAGVRCAR